MSANLREAFVGHPGVDRQSQAQRRAAAAHLILPPGLEFRLSYSDGTQSGWKPVSRGAMAMPPAATLLEVRRTEARHVSR